MLGSGLRRAGLAFGFLLVALIAAGTVWIDSALADTFTVTETGDAADAVITDSRCDTDPASGKQCTLRAAIEEANDTNGADTIDFDIGGGTGAKTISPNSELPTLTDTVTIDGYTQPGASPNTLEDGDDAVLNVQLDGINAGTGPVAGLRIEASDCAIKGLVIKRFQRYGVSIPGTDETGNRIEGNFIGISRDGTTARGNGEGVDVNGDSNTVGGADPASRNVISGNVTDGIAVLHGTENKVEGNFMGTSADGSAARGNTEDGVKVAMGASETTIGGTTAGERNVISGNGGNGISVWGAPDTVSNQISGNYIGTPADGTGDLGNTEDGVVIEDEVLQTAVGGTSEDAGNRIAHNGGDGVSVIGSFTSGAYILSNRIFDNGGLGIDLAGGTENARGVTTNDKGDADTGPNGLQNFPVITSIKEDTPAEGQTTISGTLDSTSYLVEGGFSVECYLTSKAPASAHGEGYRLLGSAPTVLSSAGGPQSFSFVSSDPRLGKVEGQTVTATATSAITGDTSEFSENKAVPYNP